MQQNHRLYAVEDRRRRVVIAARDAGFARLEAARMWFGRPDAPERDGLTVGEPEEEEVIEFKVLRSPA